MAVQENLIDEIWTGDKTEDGKGGKPPRPASEVFVLEEKYTGESSSFFAYRNVWIHILL